VALTFDDGPTPKTVQVLLPLLGERGIHATFYLIGAELERNPEAGRALVEAGHELGNHSYTHQRMVFKGAAFVERELARTDALIRQTGYTGSIHFRPPYGKKLFTLPLVLRSAGRKTITWDIEPDSDPKIARDKNAIVATTVSAVRPGSIILLHTMYRSGAPSLAAVPEIIDQLQRKGYRFVTVSELIAARTL
jgi:peptidoglycan/xylan/chitin deacetylase (PgdA/CDA1 family)